MIFYRISRALAPAIAFWKIIPAVRLFDSEIVCFCSYFGNQNYH
jgi:hypothetical protein